MARDDLVERAQQGDYQALDALCQDDGTLVPRISESEARQIAEDKIAETSDLEGSSTDSVRLAVTFGGFENSVVDNQTVLDMDARWRLAWEFALGDLPSPGSDSVIWIDAMNGR